MKRSLPVALAAAATAAAFLNCGEAIPHPTAVDRVAGPYAGSAACAVCHEYNYAAFVLTGHAHILTQVDGAAPHFPFSQVPHPPPGKSWDDISYVVGGYGWKALFVGVDGYVLTGHTQYNLKTREWADYEPGGTIPYDCGACHATGYKTPGHQNDLPGIVGTWAMPGVQCEACHGPGGEHVADPTGNEMNVDTTAGACGQCHIRGDKNLIPARDGFIQNHEQYNEHFNSVHGAPLSCVSCHDPHNPATYNGAGVYRECSDCHSQQVRIEEMAGFACTTCHMPPAVKSATGDAAKFRGDIPAHLYRINAAANAEQFYKIGNDDYSNPYINLDFACLRGGCHNGEPRAWAAGEAPHVHAGGGDGANGTKAAATRN